MTEGLGRRYGETEALSGLDLTVAPGTVLGLLGHNGAGKTTAVRILTTLLAPTSGRAIVTASTWWPSRARCGSRSRSRGSRRRSTSG